MLFCSADTDTESRAPVEVVLGRGSVPADMLTSSPLSTALYTASDPTDSSSARRMRIRIAGIPFVGSAYTRSSAAAAIAAIVKNVILNYMKRLPVSITKKKRRHLTR